MTDLNSIGLFLQWTPNNSIQRTALRDAADDGRYPYPESR
jgi:hypothetical protein